MSRVLLACWLIWGDMRRRPVEAMIFLLAITAASAALSVGLELNGATGTLYDQTMSATDGPDVVAFSPGGSAADLSALAAVGRARGVVRHSGPYPLLYTTVKTNGLTVNTLAEGRSMAPAAVDRPLVTSGSWLRPGGVVVERGFARALGVRVGDRITVAGRVFPVVGIAVTAATGVFPWAEPAGPDGGPTDNAGLLWMTETDIRALRSPYPSGYVFDLKLVDPAASYAFEDSYNMTAATPVQLSTWQSIAGQDSTALRGAEPVLDIGAWLLGFLAIAGVAGLAAGRAVQQTRRVGLLKAVGAAPGLIAAVLLAEYLFLGLLAATLGLLAGWLAAPALSDPTGGLIGTVSLPAGGTIIAVAFLALSAAILTTLAPTLRAIRTSTVRALADSSRLPRRAALTVVSRWLPAPILLGARLTARRPVRTLLHAAGITATVIAAMALLAFDAQPGQGDNLGFSYVPDPDNAEASRLLLAVTVALVLLATVNVIVIGWTTALETRRTQAIARTLGATPGQVTAGLALGQVLPALPATLVGIPMGLGLYSINAVGPMALPSGWLILTVAAGIVLAIGAFTAFPAQIAARKPAAQALSSETI
ncbi:MAG: FtsX-like permease family protein [Streptosporangiaceae bacterium]|jgi:putative ABC transport system permease protein